MLAELDTRSDEGYAALGGVLPATGQGGDASGAFVCSRESFEALVGTLAGAASSVLEHAELEQLIDRDGRELLRLLLQDHLDLRAASETRLDGVAHAAGVDRRSAERDHGRVLASVFGEVVVRRIAYRSRGACNLCPADAHLNLPAERHSHGLRRLVGAESARGSFQDAVAAIQRATGERLGKRQVEQLAARAAVDFDAFYAQRQRPEAAPGDVLVLSCDGKGVVMRPGALRAQTARAAACAENKLRTKGEKRNRKRDGGGRRGL